MSAGKEDRGNQGEPAQEVRIPLSIVLMVAGAIILITGGFIYAIYPIAPPADLPRLIPLARVPAATASPVPLPTLMTLDRTDRAIGVLLPETPLEQALPSEARADEAPTRREPVPGQPVRIEIPALGVDAPIWEVGLNPISSGEEILYRWQVPNSYAAGWHNDSALLGRRGNTVLNGHHNTYGAIFRDLIDLERGDEIILHDGDGSHYYRVNVRELLPEKGEPIYVQRANAHWIGHSADERITIVTCWPPTDNTHRLVVVATPAQ